MKTISHTTGMFFRDALEKSPFESQSKLARAINVTPQSVQRWCTGQGLPNKQHWPKLATALGIDESDIAKVVGRKNSVHSGNSQSIRVKGNNGTRLIVEFEGEIEATEFPKLVELLQPDL